MKAILVVLVTVLFTFSSQDEIGNAEPAKIAMRHGCHEPNNPFEDIPYLAFITWDNGISCAGTLISHRYVLTAAHCVLEGSNNPPLVSVGKVYFWDPWEFTVTSKSIKTFRQGTAGEYDQYNNYHNYDIALIELSECIPFTDYTQPAELPNWFDSSWLDLTEETGRSFGWDINREEVTIKPLAKIHMVSPINGNKKSYFFNTLVTDGRRGTRACKGTSGGPFVIDDIVYGVTRSFKRSCSCGEFMFTEVSHFLSWIEENADVDIGFFSNKIGECK